MVGIGLGAVVLRKVTVGREDALAAVDLGSEEEPHKAAEVEGILAEEGMDCEKELRTVVVGAVGSPGCNGPAVHILPAAAAVTEAADLVRLWHLVDTLRVELHPGHPAHSLEMVEEGDHSSGVEVGILEEGIGSVEVAGIPLSNSE